MPCTCSVTRVHTSATSAPTAGSSSSKKLSSQRPHTDDGTATASGNDSFLSSSLCFYCLCTVCGRDVAEMPTVTCCQCGSHTHLTCARDVYSHERLFGELVEHTSAAAARAAATSTSALPRQPRASSAAVQAESPATTAGLSTAPAARASPSSLGYEAAQQLRAAAARIDKDFSYYCHPDCAMGMEVMANPQFDAAISARVEAAFARDWAVVKSFVLSQLPLAEATAAIAAGPASLDSCGDGWRLHAEGAVGPAEQPADALGGASVSSSTALSAACSENPYDFVGSLVATSSSSSPALADELSRLCCQLRAEAWAEYFTQERHHSGHPLFYPPPFLDIQRNAAASHVLEAASPQGQAARLYLLDPVTHPVGSAVAVPAGLLARWQRPGVAPLLRVNDTNNFVAESLSVLVSSAVVPETVMTFRQGSKRGRRAKT